MRAFGLKRSLDRVVTQFFRYNSTESAKQIQDAAKTKLSTIDPVDVGHHGTMSPKWWTVDGPVRALHELNPLRVQFVRDGLANVGWKESSPSHPLEGLKILDAGCGGGILCEPLARIGANVTGIDASVEQIGVAREHALLDPSLSGKLNYVHGSIEDLAEKEFETYDAVVTSEVVEHVKDPKLFLKGCVDVLKPGGSIFVTTVNKTFQSWFFGIILAEYVFGLLPKGTHDWNKFIKPDEIKRILESCGCRMKLVHGILYNPIKSEWTWSSTSALTYAVHAVKGKGSGR